MNTHQLEQRLLAEGCSPNNFSIRSRGDGNLYCLDESNGTWTVFYTERGLDADPFFASTSEEKACEFFYDLIKKMTHWHLVGFFADEALAIDLQTKLTSIGVDFIRNDIPAYQHQNDPRFRVFVIGEDIFTVRAALGDSLHENA
jgi:hypothetical protein